MGTIRREYLDWVIPLSEVRLRPILKAWVEQYSLGRSHIRLGAGVPGLPRAAEVVPKSKTDIDSRQVGRTREISVWRLAP